MNTIRDVIKLHLAAQEFDGLVQPDAECGCLADDLAPCCDSPMECLPGYRGVSKDYPGEWAIYTTKEAAEASKTQGDPQ
jgi:hypothetical protein